MRFFAVLALSSIIGFGANMVTLTRPRQATPLPQVEAGRSVLIPPTSGVALSPIIPFPAQFQGIPDVFVQAVSYGNLDTLSHTVSPYGVSTGWALVNVTERGFQVLMGPRQPAGNQYTVQWVAVGAP